MDDYISRQAALDALMEKDKKLRNINWYDKPYAEVECRGIDEALSIISNLPSAQPERIPAADVAPLVHGKWLPIVSYNNTYKCSECGRLLVNIADGLKTVAKHYPYCHCGAKMDGGDEHE